MTDTPMPPASAPPPAARPRASDAFVGYVLSLCENKRVQSDLRTGLGQSVERCNYLHRYLVRRLPERLHPDARRAHYAVAALIAARPRSARTAHTERAASTEAAPGWYARSNLGASLAAAVNAQIIKAGSAEGDLHLFARQSSDALHQRLPALTRHLLSGGIALDWAVLLEDLTWWDRDRDRVVTRWLESYFRTADPEGATALDTDASIPAADTPDLHEENLA
ncbi:type I-E CRISPR-associated protein Cse2/CasB [Streptomyces pseudovenezuelae]|uniref:type I-E CRISPR-associated protein Cse2/CasB n=1 Tax=Streptomyces pseudovenezuelae TaxID=67350 RepID=UPI002E81FC7E|nr:type I-E CRISPR-associated protein Cse2/CasB [Streptomyces pseudovenezuelae]WUA87610.1 type I-E CRISPR-associated protein Cse2/CasB [Streptomyces pseudovenezuelae]